MNERDVAITTAISGPHITIHTDGAAYKNPGPGGWGAVLCRMDADLELRRKRLRGCEPDSSTTNIRMEMTAAAEALEIIKPGELQPIIVHADLQLIVRGMTEWHPGWIARGWRNSQGKPVENVDLWLRIIEATKQKTVHWLWVKGHAGDERNELAHSLADQQMRKALLIAFRQAA